MILNLWPFFRKYGLVRRRPPVRLKAVLLRSVAVCLHQPQHVRMFGIGQYLERGDAAAAGPQADTAARRIRKPRLTDTFPPSRLAPGQFERNKNG